MQMKNKDVVINIVLGSVSIVSALWGIFLIYERASNLSRESIVAEVIASILFFLLGIAVLIRYRATLVTQLRDRTLIALVGLSTGATVLSYFITYGMTSRVVMSQLPIIVLIGVITWWFIRCSRPSMGG